MWEPMSQRYAAPENWALSAEQTEELRARRWREAVAAIVAAGGVSVLVHGRMRDAGLDNPYSSDDAWRLMVSETVRNILRCLEGAGPAPKPKSPLTAHKPKMQEPWQLSRIDRRLAASAERVRRQEERVARRAAEREAKLQARQAEREHARLVAAVERARRTQQRAAEREAERKRRDAERLAERERVRAERERSRMTEAQRVERMMAIVDRRMPRLCA